MNMPENNYSLEKYVSEYLKPLKDKGIIYRIRIYPKNNRIRFRMKEPIKGFYMSAQINKNEYRNTISFNLYCFSVQYEASYEALKDMPYYINNAKLMFESELKWIKQYDKKTNKFIIESKNVYITKHLKPLEEKGLIKSVHEDGEREIWFTVAKSINGKEISAHLKPGKVEDGLFFYPTTGCCKYRPLYRAGLLNPDNDPHYTVTLEQYILQGIKYIKKQFENGMLK